jgi:hypothetical protein
MSADSLAETIADNAAEVDELADDNRDAFAARFYELLHFPAERDPDMWEDAAEQVGLDPEWLILSLSDLNGVEMQGRGLAWQFASSLIVAVAREQAFTEIMLRAEIEMAERHAASVDAADDSATRALAKSGVHKRTFDEAKERRKAGRDGEGEV